MKFAGIPAILAFCFVTFTIKAQNYRTSLPAIEILQTDSSSIYKTSTTGKDKPVVLLLFHTSCDHCQQLAKDLVRRKSELEKNQIIMISTENLYSIKAFCNRFGLLQIKNLVIGRDYKFATPKIFNFESFPFFVIYSKKHKFIASYERNFTVDTILKNTRQITILR